MIESLKAFPSPFSSIKSLRHAIKVDLQKSEICGLIESFWNACPMNSDSRMEKFITEA